MADEPNTILEEVVAAVAAEGERPTGGMAARVAPDRWGSRAAESLTRGEDSMADFVEEIERFLGSFSPVEVAVTRHAFRALLDGRAATVAELPAALSLPPAVVEEAARHLTERGIIEVEPEAGLILGARGLSLTETSHLLILEGHRRYAFCAVDAVGIPAALGTNARVESRCHHCGAPLSLALRGGAVVEAPAGMVVWAAERDLSRSLRAHT